MSLLDIAFRVINKNITADKNIIKSKGKPVWELRSKNSNFYGIEFSSTGFFSRQKLKRFIEDKLREMQG